MARYDRQRDAEQPWRRFYRTARWRRLRAAQLASEPLCRMCGQEGKTTPATVCDHVERHRGDVERFWAGPLQSLCKPHHDSAKQAQERGGLMPGCDADGMPLDPAHPWA